MTDTPAINPSQASGGKVWNPYDKKGEPSKISVFPGWTSKPSLFIPAVLIYLVVTTLLVIKGLHTIAYASDSSARSFVKSNVFYQEVHHVSILDIFLLQLIAVSVTILLMAIMLITTTIIRTKTKKNPRNFVNGMVIVTMLLDVGIVFASMSLATDHSNNEGYNAWLQQELGVETINRIIPEGSTESLFQGKDGNYKLKVDTQEEYKLYKLIKVEGK
jgi:hypothetical protein